MARPMKAHRPNAFSDNSSLKSAICCILYVLVPLNLICYLRMAAEPKSGMCYLHSGRNPYGSGKFISYFEDLLISAKRPALDNGIFFVDTECSADGIVRMTPRYIRKLLGIKNLYKIVKLSLQLRVLCGIGCPAPSRTGHFRDICVPRWHAVAHGWLVADYHRIASVSQHSFSQRTIEATVRVHTAGRLDR